MISEAQRQEAELACQRLVLDYVAAIDAGEYEKLRELFAPDATFARPTAPDQPIAGCEQIVSAFLARPRTRVTQHICTNVRIEVLSQDAARGRCSIVLYGGDAAEPLAAGKGRALTGAPLLGYFDDDFVRLAAGWRFASRRGSVSFHG